jgi:hypothetical protein
VCFELRDARTPGAPMAILERPYHLSYPFVFEQNRDVFLIPESAESRRVELYRAVSFPDQWEHVADILTELAASDSTIVEHEGLLWLYTTINSPGMSPCDNVHLYWSADVRGPWHPHRMNPVVSDVRAGRAAGRVFVHDGRLIRPAQDSARRYGHAINFQAITQLSVNDYQEVTVGRLERTEPRMLATHTYNSDDQYEVTDWLRPTFRWR